MSTTKWFVYPRGSWSNKIAGMGITVDNESSEKLCADGISRPLWEMQWQHVERLLRSKRDLDLDFSVFKQEKESLPTYFNPTTFGRGRRTNKKVRIAHDDLVRIAARKGTTAQK